MSKSLIKYKLYKDEQPPINTVCVVQTGDKNGTSKFTIAALKVLKNKFDKNKNEIVWVNHNTGKVIGKPGLEDRWFRVNQETIDSNAKKRKQQTKQFVQLRQRIRENANYKIASEDPRNYDDE